MQSFFPLVAVNACSSPVSKTLLQSCGYAQFPPYLQPAPAAQFSSAKVQNYNPHSTIKFLHLRIFQMEDLVESNDSENGCG